ncbi:hypothetical protein E4T43_03675 [Aureobasidium subglaciale]|nr:hypothetical protein E4T43_03675 [Aureobasidium subglaciale]
MADVARRTYARDDHGPRSVESRRSSTRTDYPSPSAPRTSRTPQPTSSPYTLTITTAPPSSLHPSSPFNIRILITTTTHTPTPPQNLLAILSLCHETPTGPCVLPAGHFLGPKLMDSVVAASRADIAGLSREQRHRVVGIVGFEGLCVRQEGAFRIRVTLARMVGEVLEAVAEVDSAVFACRVGRY